MSVNTVKQDGSLQRIAGGTLYADAPIGTISPFGGSSVPSGYLLCNGQAVNRTTYAELFAVIGTAFGTGDGNTTFNVPDLREAVPVGSGKNGTATIAEHDIYTLGQFKDDQFQGHNHSNCSIDYKISSQDAKNYAYAWKNDWARQTDNLDRMVDSGSGTPRTGTTTHGKQLGVNYIIKAKQVAVPADFMDAIDDAVDTALSEFAKPISLVPVNNSTIYYNKSRIIGGIVTVCASITVPSGNHLVKENAVVNVPNLGTGSIGYILPCIYRNVGSGAEEPGYAIIQTDGNLYPYYTKTEYNEIRINASYSSKI